MKSDKKNGKNPYLKTQIAIIQTLLDGSAKTQKEIADQTRYKESTVSHAIKPLIKSEVIILEKNQLIYPDKKYKGNKCSLAYDEIDNGANILTFFKNFLKQKTMNQQDTQDFLGTLQNSDMALSLVASKFIRQDTFLDENYKTEGNKELFEEVKEYYIEELKNKFNISSTFLRFCIVNDEDYFKIIIAGIIKSTGQDYISLLKKVKKPSLLYTLLSPVRSVFEDPLFEMCVQYDVFTSNDISIFLKAEMYLEEKDKKFLKMADKYIEEKDKKLPSEEQIKKFKRTLGIE